MSNSEKKQNSIPTSVLIADVRNKLNEVVNHPLLPPSILELILKEAWQSVAFKAQNQLITDYKTYSSQSEQNEQNEEEDNNGV